MKMPIGKNLFELLDGDVPNPARDVLRKLDEMFANDLEKADMVLDDRFSRDVGALRLAALALANDRGLFRVPPGAARPFSLRDIHVDSRAAEMARGLWRMRLKQHAYPLIVDTAQAFWEVRRLATMGGIDVRPEAIDKWINPDPRLVSNKLSKAFK